MPRVFSLAERAVCQKGGGARPGTFIFASGTKLRQIEFADGRKIKIPARQAAAG
jgi:hypothetical protein